MITKLIKSVAMAAFAAAALASAQAQELKIGYVNSERVLREAAPAKAALARMESDFGKRDKDLNEQAARFKSAAEKLEKDAPTLSRFFTHHVLPLVTAQNKSDKFAATKLVRESSPLLSKETLKGNDKPIAQLRAAQTAIDSLMALWADGEPTCGEIAGNIAETNLFAMPDSLKAALAAKQAARGAAPDDEEAVPVSDQIAALVAFLDCAFSEIAPYAAYVAHEAPFDTHQGVKGLEFERVMVLMDDGEARGFLFDYDKILLRA